MPPPSAGGRRGAVGASALREIRPPFGAGGRGRGGGRGGQWHAAQGASAVPHARYFGILAKDIAELVWAAQSNLWAPGDVAKDRLQESWSTGSNTILIFRAGQGMNIMVRCSACDACSALHANNQHGTNCLTKSQASDAEVGDRTHKSNLQ